MKNDLKLIGEAYNKLLYKEQVYNEDVTETNTPVVYARLEDLRDIIKQAESEHHEGSLGIVRIALRPEGDDRFDIDMRSPLHDRVLVG